MLNRSEHSPLVFFVARIIMRFLLEFLSRRDSVSSWLRRSLPSSVAFLSPHLRKAEFIQYLFTWFFFAKDKSDGFWSLPSPKFQFFLRSSPAILISHYFQSAYGSTVATAFGVPLIVLLRSLLSPIWHLLCFTVWTTWMPRVLLNMHMSFSVA